MLFETGHPWHTYKDPSNWGNKQQHHGSVRSLNLCTEITLVTNSKETAVCNLGSINLVKFVDKEGNINKEALVKAIKTAVNMLDNVIDINYYSVEKAAYSNGLHRPVGLGVMGTHNVLQKMGVPYNSDRAVEFCDEITEFICYHAIEASSDLAKAKGSYKTYEGSLWSKGIMPLDVVAHMEKERELSIVLFNYDSKLDWDALREKVLKQGMRNSNVTAIAPTATIANICDAPAGIDPDYANIAVKSNLSGEFTIINKFLVDALKERGLWDEVMANDIKYYNGSIQQIERIPDDIKKVSITAFEIDPLWLIKCGSRRQKWLCQAQSLNLFYK